MASKQRFLASNILNWFKSNVYNSNSKYKINSQNFNPQLTPSTCCYYTTHFLFNYATRPTKTPQFMDSYSYPGETAITTFWDIFRSNLCSDSSDCYHQLFHFRLNNNEEQNKGGSVHDVIVEKYDTQYMIYQSCTNLFKLSHWMDTQNNNGCDNWQYASQNHGDIVGKFYNYSKNTYGSSNILSMDSIAGYMDILESQASTAMTVTSAIRENNIADPTQSGKTWEKDVVNALYCLYGKYETVEDVTDAMIAEIIQESTENARCSFQTPDDEYVFNFIQTMQICSIGLARLFGFPTQRFIDSVSLAIYDLYDGDLDEKVDTMTTESFDENVWYQVKTCDI